MQAQLSPTDRSEGIQKGKRTNTTSAHHDLESARERRKRVSSRKMQNIFRPVWNGSNGASNKSKRVNEPQAGLGSQGGPFSCERTYEVIGACRLRCVFIGAIAAKIPSCNEQMPGVNKSIFYRREKNQTEPKPKASSGIATLYAYLVDLRACTSGTYSTWN